MKVLQVIDQAFRTTVEEQDDTILWLTQSMRGAGGELTVLLGGHGVYYGLQTQPQPALQLGDWQQSAPADLPRDLTQLLESGVPVYVILDDVTERGLSPQALRPGVQGIRRDELAALYDSVDQVWQW